MRRTSLLILGPLCAAVFAGCDAPMSPEGEKWLRAADAAYRAGDDAKAIDSASRFLQLHPGIQEAGEAYYFRGLARCRSGQTEAGRQDLAAAVAATRRKDLAALAHTKLGELAYAGGDLDEAASRYEAALAQTPPDAPPADQAMYRLGCIRQRQGRWREADSHFDQLMHFFEGTALQERAKQRVRSQRWSVQAAAAATSVAAETAQAKLREAGLSPRVDLELRGGRLLRLVRVGSYRLYEDGAADLAKVRRAFPDAYLTPAR